MTLDTTASPNGRSRAFAILTLVLVSTSNLFLTTQSVLAQDDQAVVAMAKAASNAQNAGDYEFAASAWEELINKFPNSDAAVKAHFNAGVCQMYSSKHAKAMEHFSTALPKLETTSVQKSEASLFLGFCQFRAGQKLKPAGQQEPAKVLLTTATQTLKTLIDVNPTFDDLDQACYYQGEAFNELDRLDDALASYTRMLSCPKQTLKMEGIYAVADTYDRLGQYAKAIEYFDKFQAEAKAAGGNPLLNEIKMRSGATLMSLARAAETNGDQADADAKLKRASVVLTEVAELTSTDPDTLKIIDEAKFELAFCSREMGEFEKAADLYEKLAAKPDSPYAAESVVNAGRNYIDAGQVDKAAPLLQKTIAADSQYSDLAAHWLAETYLLKSKNPQLAYDVASKQLARPSTKARVSLKMDQAEAAYQIPERLKESAELFKAISDKHSDHPLAPSALHNSAFAHLDLNDFAKTIETATEFESKYSESDYLADTLELKAEAYLLSNKAGEANTVFEQLGTKFPKHKNNSFWKLRSGLALYLQENYQGAIDRLTPVVDQFESTARKAETLFWIGSSQYQLKKYPDAASSLKRSSETDQQWKRADENLLMLAQAQVKSDQLAEAKVTAEAMISAFPESKMLSELYFHLGEGNYKAEQYTDAITSFQKIIDKNDSKRFVPLALYKAALTQVKLEKFAESEKLFSDLIAKYPDHELAKEAQADRGAMRLKTGDAASSIADLKAFLATNPDGKTRVETLYKIGLAQIEMKDWDSAISTLKMVITEGAELPKKDHYYYDLAWAYKYRSLDTPDADDLSTDYFQKIVDEAPESKLAGEASFHVGNTAYEKQEYEAAAKAFADSFDSKTSDNVREKAAYKLGWSHYKQNNFPESHASFEKQIAAFPQGDLMADGAFMVGESLFRQKKYEPAYRAYVKAKPAVDASKTIQPTIKSLTKLHGSQAANKAKLYSEALVLANELADSEVDLSLKQDAWLEAGTAYQGMKQSQQAVDSWKKASESLGKTGARATCLIGDQLFKEAIQTKDKAKFAEAIKQFKLVFFGFGGTESAKDVQAWQAYAVYEAARCNFVQVKDAPPELQPKLKADAIKLFEYLLKNYPNDALAKEAQNQLNALKKLK